MNKTFRILCSLTVAAALWGCGKEPLPEGDNGGNAPAPEVEKPVVYADNEVVATFSGGLTKTMNDAEGAYTWAENDSIAVYTTRGHFVTYYLTEGAGQTTAKFKAQLREGEKPLAFASYPVGTAHYQMDKLSVVMPSSYKVNDGLNQVPMMAQFEEGTQQISFAPLTGVLLITMEGIPAEATTFQFRTEDNTRVTGKFDFDQNGITAAQGEGKDVVTVDFTPGQSRMSFAIPLPAGTYSRFTIGFRNSEGVLLSSTIRTSGNVQVQNARVKELQEFNSSMNIIYVKPGATGFGSSWEDASSLEAALETAPDGALIKVAAGTHVPTKSFMVRSNVSIQGGYPAEGGTDEQVDSLNATVISGQINETQKAYHAMVVAAAASDVSVKLSGLTFTGGEASANETTTTVDDFKVYDNCGAGLILASDAEVSGCTFISNKAPQADACQGGGMYVMANVKASLTDCTFKDNEAGQGGAISTGSNAEVTLERCLFEENTAKYGGAVVLNSGTEMAVNHSVFDQNSATGAWGGAIRNFAKLTIENSVFTSNSTPLTAKDCGGGAIQNNRNTLVIKNCRFEDNHSINGGAVCNFGEANTTIEDSHFEGNTAVSHTLTALTSGYGGAVHNFFSTNQGTLNLTGCHFLENEATYGGAVGNQVGLIVVDDCVFEGNVATKNHGGAVLTFGADLSSNAAIATGKRALAYIYNSLFDSNTASSQQGGAIKVHGFADLAVVNTTFKANEGGSGIIRLRSQNAGEAKMWLVSSTFSGNNKYSLYNQSSYAYIYNTVMDDLNSYRSNNKAGQLVAQKSVFNNAGHSMVQNLDFTGEVKDNAALSGASTLENTVVGSFADGVFSVSGAALTGGMSSDELSALGSDIKAAMPLFDESKLLVDQNANSRVGKTAMGASVQ